jgi:hypothetical protein
MKSKEEVKYTCAMYIYRFGYTVYTYIKLLELDVGGLLGTGG